MKAVVTISSVDYLAQSVASLTTAKELYGECDYVILLMTMRDVSYHNSHLSSRDIKVINLPALADHGRADSILYKYGRDFLRWALKPSLFTYLLERYENVIYVDNDVMFTGPWGWLWEVVAAHDITLTPHRSSITAKQVWNDGVYNAGFIGASRGGLPTIAKWDELCEWRCEINREEGLFVDQKYLDLFPAICDCKVLRHNGCNVATWNLAGMKVTHNNTGIIVGGDPLVFLHLSGSPNTPFFQPHRKRFAEMIEAELSRLQTADIITQFCP